MLCPLLSRRSPRIKNHIHGASCGMENKNDDQDYRRKQQKKTLKGRKWCVSRFFPRPSELTATASAEDLTITSDRNTDGATRNRYGWPPFLVSLFLCVVRTPFFWTHFVFVPFLASEHSFTRGQRYRETAV